MQSTNSERQLLNLLIKNNLTSWRKSVNEISEAELATLLKDNRRMQAAIGKALSAPGLWEDTAQTILDMFVFIYRHNLKKDWAGWIESALLAAPNTKSELYCHLLGRHGQMQRLVGGKDGTARAIVIHTQALELAKALDNPILQGLGYFQLSEDFRSVNDIDQALKMGQQAVDILSQQEHVPVPYVASAYTALGLAYLDANDMETAKQILRKPVVLFEQNENAFEHGLSLINLGLVAHREEDYEAALHTYHQAEQILTDIQATFNLLLLYINLGSLYYHLQKYDAAREMFQKMDTPYMLENGHIWHLAMKTHGLGDIAHMLGDPARALPYLDEAVRRWREIDEPLRLAYTLATREGVHLDLRNGPAAQTDFEEASTYIADYRDHAEAAQAQKVLDKWQQKRAAWPYGQAAP